MTISRREFLDFLKATCAVAALPGALTSSASDEFALSGAQPRTADSSEAIVNDIRSQLNATRVNGIMTPLSTGITKRCSDPNEPDV